MKATEASGTLTLRIEQKPKQYTLKLTALKNHALGGHRHDQTARQDASHGCRTRWHRGQTITFSTSRMLTNTISDAMLISLQKTCPVTGKSLGSMGTPPKIIVKGKPLFVCCAPCSAKSRLNPMFTSRSTTPPKENKSARVFSNQPLPMQMRSTHNRSVQ